MEISYSAERQYLSPPRENPAAFHCFNCGEGICFDDNYYVVDGVVYCEGCMESKRYTVRESDLERGA